MKNKIGEWDLKFYFYVFILSMFIWLIFYIWGRDIMIFADASHKEAKKMLNKDSYMQKEKTRQIRQESEE